ncbi:hypothetical protein KI387_000242, partial [Taxus chinensis]
EEVKLEQDGLQIAKEGEATPNPKGEEYIPAMEEKNVVPEASNPKQAIEEPSILPSTSSLSSFSVEKEFYLSNFMLEDERNHVEQVANKEDTMEGVDYL